MTSYMMSGTLNPTHSLTSVMLKVLKVPAFIETTYFPCASLVSLGF